MSAGEIESVLVKEPEVGSGILGDILQSCAGSYKKYSVLATALETGMFELLKTPLSSRDLSLSLQTDPGLTEKICRSLHSMGFLEEKNGQYVNTEVSRHYLCSDSPLFQRNAVLSLQRSMGIWSQLPVVLKKGPMALKEENFFKNMIHGLAEQVICGELQKTVEPIAEIPEFKKAKRLLDLGGGHGLYAAAFTVLNPGLTAYVYDFPEVVGEAKKYIGKFNTGRVKVIPGNYFTDNLGDEYDVIFFSYNPGGKNPSMVPKIYNALKAGGLYINKQCFYSEKEKESKNILLDIEWRLTDFEGLAKGEHIYSFAGDLSFEEYLTLLDNYFTVLNIIDAPAFAGSPLKKIGDALDSKIIIARKKDTDNYI